MFRRIKDFDGTPAFQQIRKCYEELDELSTEVVKGNVQGIRTEGADLIQTVITMWVNMGYKMEDIEEIFKELYIKESRRGRTIVCIDGETWYDKTIADLLDVINKREKEIRILKGALRIICKIS